MKLILQAEVLDPCQVDSARGPLADYTQRGKVSGAETSAQLSRFHWSNKQTMRCKAVSMLVSLTFSGNNSKLLVSLEQMNYLIEYSRFVWQGCC